MCLSLLFFSLLAVVSCAASYDPVLASTTNAPQEAEQLSESPSLIEIVINFVDEVGSTDLPEDAASSSVLNNESVEPDTLPSATPLSWSSHSTDHVTHISHGTVPSSESPVTVTDPWFGQSSSVPSAFSSTPGWLDLITKVTTVSKGNTPTIPPTDPTTEELPYSLISLSLRFEDFDSFSTIIFSRAVFAYLDVTITALALNISFAPEANAFEVELFLLVDDFDTPLALAELSSPAFLSFLQFTFTTSSIIVTKQPTANDDSHTTTDCSLRHRPRHVIVLGLFALFMVFSISTLVLFARRARAALHRSRSTLHTDADDFSCDDDPLVGKAKSDVWVPVSGNEKEKLLLSRVAPPPPYCPRAPPAVVFIDLKNFDQQQSRA